MKGYFSFVLVLGGFSIVLKLTKVQPLPAKDAIAMEPCFSAMASIHLSSTIFALQILLQENKEKGKMDFDDERKYYYRCCGSEFFFHITEIILFVMFAGLMNGLTLGYMSMNPVDLEVLIKSGSPKHSRFASKILTLIKKRHLLLCTLVISKAFAVEALPIFIHRLVPETSTILISTLLILIFTEIIPHSICSHYGLLISSAMAPAIRVLVWICFPAAYPISKLLDFLLGRGRVALYRRAELKTLVDLHGNEAGKGGDLSCHEVSIIKGALEITEKTAGDAMTPKSQVFSVDINANLDRDMLRLIIEKGHSRVPVYYEEPDNIVGLILVKNLLSIKPAGEVPIKNLTIRAMPRVAETMPLIQLLKEFQRGLSHMAVVITRPRTRNGEQLHTTRPLANREDVRLVMDGEGYFPRKRSFRQSLIRTSSSLSSSSKVLPGNGNVSRSRRWSGESHPEILNLSGDNPLLKQPKEEEVVGIITMEDVIEELLKDDIYDEMDHYGSSQTSFHVFSNRIHDVGSSKLSDRITHLN